MILYYCLMTKVDWFRRYYGIFLGGLSQVATSAIGTLTTGARQKL
jgi:hypothetical protein